MSSDHWETPAFVWHEILSDIDRKNVLWDPFYCSGRSQIYLEDLGFKVIAPKKRCPQSEKKETDCPCLIEIPECDMIVTNPPFSKLESVIPRILEIGKPSIVLMPVAAADTDWFSNVVDEYGAECLVEELPGHIGYIRDGILEPNCNFLSCVLYIRLNDMDKEEKIKIIE